MIRRMPGILAIGALVVFGSTAAAQQKPQVKSIPIQRTSATDAKQMFSTYCAACHGKEGKGDGPAAKALTKTPADLTQLTAKNGGKFPEAEVFRFIQGADQIAAHGSRDMPIWGDLFQGAGNGGENTVQLRIRNLTEYIRTLQK